MLCNDAYRRSAFRLLSSLIQGVGQSHTSAKNMKPSRLNVEQLAVLLDKVKVLRLGQFLSGPVAGNHQGWRHLPAVIIDCRQAAPTFLRPLALNFLPGILLSDIRFTFRRYVMHVGPFDEAISRQRERKDTKGNVVVRVSASQRGRHWGYELCLRFGGLPKREGMSIEVLKVKDAQIYREVELNGVRTSDACHWVTSRQRHPKLLTSTPGPFLTRLTFHICLDLRPWMKT